MRATWIAIAAGFGLGGCSAGARAPAEQTSATYLLAGSTMFPADRSLARAEDGVILPDGRLIVADQRHGLVEVGDDGSVRPFGAFADGGYLDDPKGKRAAPNGVHLSPDGNRITVADVFTGVIYSTEIATGKTQAVYRHGSTVNTAIEDSTGAIWFTQSTVGTGEAEMFAAVDRPLGDGALLRLARNPAGAYDGKPEVLVDGLDFANGFYLDEEGKRLFLSETIADRVLAFSLDVAKGTIGNRRVLATVGTPDNIRRDGEGNLWVASPVSNRVYVIDPEDGSKRIGFDAQTRAGKAALAEWNKRGNAGVTRLDMLGPDVTGDMPGLLTGIIVDRENRPIYVSNLGNALVKLPR